MSRPTRARGLKLSLRISGLKVLKSRPTRARGLKQWEYVIPYVILVAPHAGAWIETSYAPGTTAPKRRAPRGRVD